MNMLGLVLPRWTGCLHSFKTCELNSTLILVVTCGQLKDYLRGVKDSVNPKFASSDSKTDGTKTKHVFPPFLRLALVRWIF